MAEHQRITIELFGIPRLRAGVAEFSLAVTLPCRLSDVFREIEAVRPQLGRELFAEGELKKEFIANVSGKVFTRSPDYEIEPADSVLILSSDAGG